MDNTKGAEEKAIISQANSNDCRPERARETNGITKIAETNMHPFAQVRESRRDFFQKAKINDNRARHVAGIKKNKMERYSSIPS